MYKLSLGKHFNPFFGNCYSKHAKLWKITKRFSSSRVQVWWAIFCCTVGPNPFKTLSLLHSSIPLCQFEGIFPTFTSADFIILCSTVGPKISISETTDHFLLLNLCSSPFVISSLCFKHNDHWSILAVGSQDFPFYYFFSFLSGRQETSFDDIA